MGRCGTGNKDGPNGGMFGSAFCCSGAIDPPSQPQSAGLGLLSGWLSGEPRRNVGVALLKPSDVEANTKVEANYPNRFH